jgi:hypothetical protein
MGLFGDITRRKGALVIRTDNERAPLGPALEEAGRLSTYRHTGLYCM